MTCLIKKTYKLTLHSLLILAAAKVLVTADPLMAKLTTEFSVDQLQSIRV